MAILLCRYKYILAYLPVVAFYYQGKVALKFKLSTSYKDLKDDIANMTGTVHWYRPFTVTVDRSIALFLPQPMLFLTKYIDCIRFSPFPSVTERVWS